MGHRFVEYICRFTVLYSSQQCIAKRCNDFVLLRIIDGHNKLIKSWDSMSSLFLRMIGKLFRVVRRLTVFLYNCFPLERGGFDRQISQSCMLRCHSLPSSSLHVPGGHLGLFHTDISSLNWPKMVCMRDLEIQFACLSGSGLRIYFLCI